VIEPATDQRAGITTVVSTLSVLYAVTFFCGALLHTGVQIPLGFAVLAEPTIIPATVVEGLCGLVLAVAAFACRKDRVPTRSVTNSNTIALIAEVSPGDFGIS